MPLQRPSDFAADGLGDRADIPHDFVKGIRRDGLLAVAQCALGIVVDFDHQSVRAAGGSSQRHRPDIAGYAGGVAGIDYHRQVGNLMQHRHGRKIQRAVNDLLRKKKVKLVRILDTTMEEYEDCVCIRKADDSKEAFDAAFEEAVEAIMK